MDIRLAYGSPFASTKDTLAAFDFEGANYVPKYFEKNQKMAKQVLSVISTGDFKGKDGQVSIIYTFDQSTPQRMMLIGLGAKEKFHLNKLRTATAQAVNYARQLGIAEITLPVFGQHLGVSEADIVSAMAEAAILAEHKFDMHKSEKQQSSLKGIIICASKEIPELQEALNYGTTVSANCCSARDLINTPASTATPKYVADKAAELSKKNGIKCTVYDKKDLEKMGANGILAVAAGSVNEPRLVVLEYAPKSPKKSYALVGKGITFDSGGLDIKPAPSMEGMKYDKSGAIGVLYTVLSAAQLKLPIRVIGILALSENMPGGNAFKPGDIIRTMSGKTIEILNTDAEGRVLMSDALHHAKSFNPDYIIDIATLTGACFVTLGYEAAGLVSNDNELAEKLKIAGTKTYERVWELPFFPEYQDYIKSDFADMKNVVSNQPGGGGAGSVTAARFLANFVEGCKWAHLDIAGVAWSDTDSGYKPRGATGYGVRLLTQLLKDDSGSQR